MQMVPLPISQRGQLRKAGPYECKWRRLWRGLVSILLWKVRACCALIILHITYSMAGRSIASTQDLPTILYIIHIYIYTTKLIQIKTCKTLKRSQSDNNQCICETHEPRRKMQSQEEIVDRSMIHLIYGCLKYFRNWHWPVALAVVHPQPWPWYTRSRSNDMPVGIIAMVCAHSQNNGSGMPVAVAMGRSTGAILAHDDK